MDTNQKWKDKILSFMTTCMEIEDIVSNETSKNQKNKY